MKLKHVYFVLAIIGLILPLSQIVIHMDDTSFSIFNLLKNRFSSDILSYIGFDIFIASIIFIIFMYIEAKRMNMKKIWMPIFSVIFIGIAFGLPMFLYLREDHLEKMFFKKK